MIHIKIAVHKTVLTCECT